MASVTASSSATTASPGSPCSPARWITLTSRQRFVAEIGRDSSMRTVSPTCASLVSSCALNFVVKRMTRLYSRWRASRSTDTTIVLSILSLTTRPTLVFRLACTCVAGPVIAGSSRRPSGLLGALALHGEDPRDRSSGLGDRAVVLQLAGRQREAGLPEVLLRVDQGLVQLGVRERPDLVDIHQLASRAPSRMTTRVCTGSLWLASRIASTAESWATPAISNRIRPGLTTATQWSGAPLPEPMRVSA